MKILVTVLIPFFLVTSSGKVHAFSHERAIPQNYYVHKVKPPAAKTLPKKADLGKSDILLKKYQNPISTESGRAQQQLKPYKQTIFEKRPITSAKDSSKNFVQTSGSSGSGATSSFHDRVDYRTK